MNILKKDIPSIHALKAILAALVVILHTPLRGKEIIEPVFWVAVPCFYIISGYFLYSGSVETENSRAKRWVRKIFFANVMVNLSYVVFYKAQGGMFSLEQYLHVLLTGTGVTLHTWYLAAMWQALCLFIIIRNKMPKLIYWAMLLCVLNPIFGRYSFVFSVNDHPIYMRANCISVALPYMCMGYAIAKNQHLLKLIKRPLLIAFICVLCAYIESCVLNCLGRNNGVSYLLTTTPMAICFFVAALCHKGRVNDWIVKIGKYHSANIYYFHIMISVVCWYMCRHFFDFSCVVAVVVFGGALLFSYMLNYIIGRLRMIFERRMNA